jgi:hypothetical protein
VQYGFAAPEFADKLLLSWLAHTLNTLQVQKDKYFEKKRERLKKKLFSNEGRVS